MSGRRAVFLDRDGTINVEKEYLHRSDDFEFIPGATEAIRLFREAGYLVVVVTNQAGVARAYYDESAVELLHSHMAELLAANGTGVDAIYYCPHHPDFPAGDAPVECSCRKPAPGMLLQASSDLGIDLSGSWMIGDKLADVEAGLAAGCRSALVLTGYGSSQTGNLPGGVQVFADLLAAARAISSAQGLSVGTND